MIGLFMKATDLFSQWYSELFTRPAVFRLLYATTVMSFHFSLNKETQNNNKLYSLKSLMAFCIYKAFNTSILKMINSFLKNSFDEKI